MKDAELSRTYALDDWLPGTCSFNYSFHTFRFMQPKIVTQFEPTYHAYALDDELPGMCRISY